MQRRRLQILLVDDDEDDFIITQDLLTEIEGLAFDLEWEAEYEPALEIIVQQRHDVYLIDYRLGQHNGLELLCEAIEQGCQAPLILLTGQEDRQVDLKAMEGGAADYLVKGQVDALLLERTIRYTIERKRAQIEIQRRNRELTLLNRIIAASTLDLSQEAILEIACRELAFVFDLPQVSAALLNDEKTTATIIAEYVDEKLPMSVNETILIVGNPAFQYLLTRQAPLAINEAQMDSRLAPLHHLMHQRGTVTLLLVPLTIESEVIGNLELNAVEPRRFTTADINLAWSVADQVAGVLARTRLAQAHQYLITAIEQTDDSVIVTDTAGRIIYVNSGFERVSGYHRAEVVGQTMTIVKSDQHDEDFYADLWATIKAGKIWRGCFINKKKDGSLYTEEATITPVRDDKGTILSYVGVQRDVTRQLQLEEQLRQSQKMDAIGKLAGGIAHDFNNLLTAIMSYSALALEILPADHLVYDDIVGIQQTAQRAANLTRQLLAFARKQIIKPEMLDLNDLVINMDKMLRRLIGEDIELITLPFQNLWTVQADHGQLEQVLVNLVLNARDAMPQGGKLTIETANVTLDQTYAGQHLELARGDYVMLTISDTGLGLTEEVKAHIFEPFFTTKDVGQGLGLGLATVFGIIKQNNGHILVYSEPDQGVTFKIYLPRAPQRDVSAAQPEEDQELPFGTEIILVVEDEPVVRDLMTRTLRQQGYQVLEAINGEDALRLAKEHTDFEKIQLLLTDVVMPRMGGKALADRLKATYPNLKVLYMSGYTDNAIVRHGILEPEVSFLQKPFAPNVLIRKVRQILDEA
jgi:PAS domain S-box-containing protein